MSDDFRHFFRAAVDGKSDSALRGMRAATERSRGIREGTYVTEGARGCFARLPPLLTEFVDTNQIGAQRGRREAPAGLLLAIAEGLATGDHWWLMSPSNRRRSHVTIPASTGMAGVAAVIASVEARTDAGPNARVRGSTFEWVPFYSKFDDNYDRKIVIRVEPNADIGTIQWSSGKWTSKGDRWECSCFIAGVLSILPGAENDGLVARMFEQRDTELAARIAAILEAKVVGITGAIYDPATGQPIALDVNKHERDLFFLGHEPRRAWTIEGAECRFARWRNRDELQSLVAETKPVSWEATQNQD